MRTVLGYGVLVGTVLKLAARAWRRRGGLFSPRSGYLAVPRGHVSETKHRYATALGVIDEPEDTRNPDGLSRDWTAEEREQVRQNEEHYDWYYHRRHR